MPQSVEAGAWQQVTEDSTYGNDPESREDKPEPRTWTMLRAEVPIMLQIGACEEQIRYPPQQGPN